MIRSSAVCLMAGVSSALACSAPPDAIALSSASADAPAAYALVGTPPVSQPFDIEIVFCVPTTGDMDDLEFDAVMPAHQHGMNFRVDVAELDGNRFKISNVVFHMPGLWEMRIKAVNRDEVYSYVADMSLE